MIAYKKLYISLLNAEELPDNFTGNWEEDKKEFILAQEELEKIIDQIDTYIDEEEQEQEDFN